MVVGVVRAFLVVFVVGLELGYRLPLLIDLDFLRTGWSLFQLHARHFLWFLVGADRLAGKHSGHVLRREDVTLILLAPHCVACLSTRSTVTDI